MLESLIHVQPLELRLLAACNNIDVIAAAQTMVKDAQQAVAVRWIVHADRLTPARQCIVYISGRLMAEAVVIVSPGMTGEQNIQGRERPAPGESFALLKPFGVLGGHRIDDLRERLVRGPHAMTARKQVPFEPSLAEMLAQYLHHAAIRAE